MSCNQIMIDFPGGLTSYIPSIYRMQTISRYFLLFLILISSYKYRDYNILVYVKHKNSC